MPSVFLRILVVREREERNPLRHSSTTTMSELEIKKQIDFISSRLESGGFSSDKFDLAEAVLCDLLDRLEAIADKKVKF